MKQNRNIVFGKYGKNLFIAKRQELHEDKKSHS